MATKIDFNKTSQEVSPRVNPARETKTLRGVPNIQIKVAVARPTNVEE